MAFRTGEPLTEKDLAAQLPPQERLDAGPVAIIECIEEIPCNPCVESCPHGAIAMPGGLNGIPRLDWQRCIGCGLCISCCPGLAICIVDLSTGNQKASVSLPYEFTPLPKKGEEIVALDRQGQELGAARVVRVQRGQRLNRTSIVTIFLPRKWALKARHLRRKSP
jgi:Fe-S-cluster-containing hydrogenase component 2